jgi:hypothetical protein
MIITAASKKRTGHRFWIKLPETEAFVIRKAA